MEPQVCLLLLNRDRSLRQKLFPNEIDGAWPGLTSCINMQKHHFLEKKKESSASTNTCEGERKGKGRLAEKEKREICFNKHLRKRKKGKRQRLAGCEREKTDQALPDRGPEILLIWWKNTNMNITAISDRNTGVNCARNKSFSERISLNRTEPPRKP